MNQSVFLLGAGAAGGSLVTALSKAGYELVGVYDPDEDRASSLAQAVGTTAYCKPLPAGLKDADIVLVAVPDPLIEQVAGEAVANNLCSSGSVWFHLSGGLPASVLVKLKGSVKAIGTFHPAHPFPPGKVTEIEPGSGFAFDGDDDALAAANSMANALGGFTVQIPAEARPAYHAATVMVSNYVAALMSEASNALSTAGVQDFGVDKLLSSLAMSAAVRANDLGIDKSLSGPILRGDSETISRHLKALESNPDALNIYRQLGQSTLRLAKKLGQIDEETAAKISRLFEA